MPEIAATRVLTSIFNESQALKWIQKASSSQRITWSITTLQGCKSHP